MSEQHGTSATLRLKRREASLRRSMERALDSEHLAFEHWQVLAALLEEPGLRMTDLAEAAVLPAATLTRHVDRLVQHDLVTRRVDPDDRRRTVVALSPRGARVAARLHGVESGAAAAGEVPAVTVKR